MSLLTAGTRIGPYEIVSRIGAGGMSEVYRAHDPRLVRLFDAAVESPHAYWFACRRSALARRPVRLFHDWLIAELGG